MNILVTGANGFIGRRLSSRLMAQGHQVFGLSLKSPSKPSLGFKQYFQQDITKPFSIKYPFDLVVHLAAYNITNVGAKDEDKYKAVNIDGTRHLLQGVDAKRLIYLSTAKVYKNEGLGLIEDSPVFPLGAYEQSKFRAEEICQAFLKKGPLVILRSVNVVGAGQAPKAVIPVFFKKAKAGQPLDIMYGGEVPMQFVYVEDLVDAFEAVIRHEKIEGIYNIAYERTVILKQLARKIIKMTHSISALNISKSTAKVLFSPVVCNKAYKQLGWKAKTNLTRVLELYWEENAKNF